jgi:hypothetical protein
MPEARIRSRTVEFLRSDSARSDSDDRLISPNIDYLRTQGFDELVDRVHTTLDQRDLLKLLNRLRYRNPTGEASNGADTAAATLAADAGRFLPRIEETGRALTQVDVVTKAAELWALPLEACYAEHGDWLARPDAGVVVTRRIRGGFSEDTLPWPEEPRVLFVHAAVETDLGQDLVDQHKAAIHAALGPWSGGADPEKWFGQVEVLSVQDLESACKEFRPSYIHLLAHGKAYAPDPELPQHTAWGLRLGYRPEEAVPPETIARALAPRDGSLLVVTVAGCDSANAASVFFPRVNLAQDLHRLGVPVVVGSQLPLTKAGSVTFTETFYLHLLRGADVRCALHAGRVALRKNENAHHDWLSLVGYVRLPPEGYGEYLLEFGLRAELGMLESLQKSVDRLIANNASAEEFDAAEARIRQRIDSLAERWDILDKKRPDLLDECGGLRASAAKRLAELLFRRAALRAADRQKEDRERSRAVLAESLDHYEASYHRNIGSHWVGVQKLALEAVLTGEFADPVDWHIVRRAAEISRKQDRKDYWACGTLAEIHLLSRIANGTSDLDRARNEVRELRRRAGGHQLAIDITRRQLQRYVDWWTAGNEYFAGKPDLSAEAQELITTLDEEVP